MAKASNKMELMAEAEKEFQKIWVLIEQMPVEMQEANFNFPENIGKEAHWTRDKNLRDVLIHIAEWQNLFLRALEVDKKDESFKFFPEPYNWRTYGAMNLEFWKKHQKTPLTEAKKTVLDNHQEILKMLGTFSQEDVFEKRRFAWTGNASLSQYATSATSGHYRWAQKKLKQHKKFFL